MTRRESLLPDLSLPPHRQPQSCQASRSLAASEAILVSGAKGAWRALRIDMYINVGKVIKIASGAIAEQEAKRALADATLRLDVCFRLAR
jgi:hypothetical protein